MKILTLEGLLSERKWGEDDHDTLYCGNKIVAEWAEDNIGQGKQITLRYWITNKRCTKEEALADFIETISGASDTEWGARYSDVTGYLWTDEDFKVGGHDMINQLKSDIGKYLILEVEVHS